MTGFGNTMTPANEAHQRQDDHLNELGAGTPRTTTWKALKGSMERPFPAGGYLEQMYAPPTPGDPITLYAIRELAWGDCEHGCPDISYHSIWTDEEQATRVVAELNKSLNSSPYSVEPFKANPQFFMNYYGGWQRSDTFEAVEFSDMYPRSDADVD